MNDSIDGLIYHISLTLEQYDATQLEGLLHLENMMNPALSAINASIRSANKITKAEVFHDEKLENLASCLADFWSIEDIKLASKACK